MASTFADSTCFRAEKLQFWKQFTTFERAKEIRKHLFSRWKITILKAIHNYGVRENHHQPPVFALKNYNFESNSQRERVLASAITPCFRAEKLQFWKQFTTITNLTYQHCALFSRWKITILKAIHNCRRWCNRHFWPVFALKNYNFESNSQLLYLSSSFSHTCFRAEKLQFWKQFTTDSGAHRQNIGLFSRWKITILKAIHNSIVTVSQRTTPVFALKNYNFESNSQQYRRTFYQCRPCFRAEKLQFWKQFTTTCSRTASAITLFSRWKITILKAIHNREWQRT